MSYANGIELPKVYPTRLGPLLDKRRSSRSFARGSVTLSDLARVLWSGYGRRSDAGYVVPSAHALHRLSIAVIAGEVEGLTAGAYLYIPENHGLTSGIPGDHREAIAATTLADRDWSTTAPVLLVVTAEFDALNTHFRDQPPQGHRGERYAWLETGHVSQSIYLAAADLDLAVALVAGFDDDRLSDVAESLLPTLPKGSRAVAILALGEPQAAQI